ncbi:hypothetical protein AB0I68_07200 [Streptomyces sp. NPDC050448]|uniref:hypothetical protein n=1 Tax=Streptomyces sp. NPDC050448 TaxID=3155404 RepID=UPI00343F1628
MVEQLGSRLMHGKSTEGDWRSAAGRFLISRASARGSVTGVLAVTDRRWFGLFDVSPLWRMAPEPKQYGEAPRAAVARRSARQPDGSLPEGPPGHRLRRRLVGRVLASLPARAAPFADAAAGSR